MDKTNITSARLALFTRKRQGKEIMKALFLLCLLGLLPTMALAQQVVHSDSTLQRKQNAIKEYDLVGDNIVHYNLPASQQSAIEHFLGVTAFPTYMLIDREGNVLDANADPRYHLESLARLLDRIK